MQAKNQETQKYIRMCIAESLINYRKAQGLSQKQFAEKVNAGQSLIAMWEKGERGLTADRLVELAMLLGTTPNYLLGFENLNKSSVINKVDLAHKNDKNELDYETYIDLLFLAYQKKCTALIKKLNENEGLEVIVKSNLSHTNNEFIINFSVKYP